MGNVAAAAGDGSVQRSPSSWRPRSWPHRLRGDHAEPYQLDRQSPVAGPPAAGAAVHARPALARSAWSAVGPAARARASVAVAAARGAVVLTIWASWCDPCRQEAPVLERGWRADGRPTGTLFVGLDQQDAGTDARAFVRSYGIDYLNVHDAGNDVPVRYGATGVPETFFISARGRVVDHVVGVISPGQLRAGIAAARRDQPLH
ncbi:MAG: TlpA family protein disulfide reductase, partial [Solirubrobacteraceae bacterium]